MSGAPTGREPSTARSTAWSAPPAAWGCPRPRRRLGLLEHQRAPGSGDRAAVEELLALLTAAVAEDALRDFGPPEGFEPHLVLPHFEPRNLIVVVETAEPFARELQLRLSHFGFELQMFERAAGAQGAPAAAAAVRAACGADVPVVFVSSRADIEARLEAVRAGCNGYFVKPVNFSEVVTTLDRLTRSEPEPYRILIVDDEAEAAAYHAASLEAAGLQTAIVTDPLQVTSQLVEFRPDVILMDVYMPRCSGAELAAVIRQEEAFVGVPIVFLSRETDRMKQIAALGEGGDDFFSKPVPPAELVAAVAARALRGRTLRQLMERDGLTGLYTHSRIIEQLEAAVRRADRRDGRLAVAMIDVDGFKGINDSHGHLAGDQVLKALAQLLRQRLRLSDILGRFGGDEYLVVLPDTDGAAALAKMDDIRCNFGAVEHDTGRQSFSVTLSAGIAEFPLAVTGHELIARADEALYRAKRAGRNRVVLAREEG
ncbi:MAG: diguanylate cyclase [Thermoanaerobaculales bacterium]|nr:diguanylate cyclase [Thermoanaerobaculales bacterium]